jgi:hypothetical protein
VLSFGRYRWDGSGLAPTAPMILWNHIKALGAPDTFAPVRSAYRAMPARKVVACVLSLSIGLAAIPNARAFSYAGSGTASCGTWTAERNDGGTVAQQWILGFLAGFGWQGGGDPLAKTDAQGVWGWIDRYC